MEFCETATVEEEPPDLRRPFVGRKLGLPEEVMQMAWYKQIVFIGNKKPAVLKIRPYWKRPELRGSSLDNSYHGRTPGMPKT